MRCAAQCANCLRTTGTPWKPRSCAVWLSTRKRRWPWFSSKNKRPVYPRSSVFYLSIYIIFLSFPSATSAHDLSFLEAHPLSPLYPQVPPYSTPPTRRRMLHPQPRGDWPETFASQCQTREVPGRMGTNEGRTYPPQGRLSRHPRSGRAHINPF